MVSEDFQFYKNLAELATTKKGKINFFDQNQKAFFLDIESDEWFEMMLAYAKQNKLSQENIEELEMRKWNEMPENLKIFAYDFCILNGFVFTGVGK